MLIVVLFSPFSAWAFFLPSSRASIRIEDDSEENAGETDAKQPLGCWSGMPVAVSSVSPVTTLPSIDSCMAAELS